MTYSGRQFPRTTKLRKEFSEMESGMQGTVDLDADNTKRGKTFMACTPCRDRKVSCDGKSPECSTCMTSGLRCEYRAIRKMRGPGKKKVKGPSSDKSLEIRVTTRLQEKEGLCDEQSNSTNAEDQSEVTKATPQSSRGVVTFDSSTGIESRLRQLYPVFLHPENIMRVQQEIIRASQKAQRSPEGFAPLPPKDIVHYALRNTYDDIMNICPIFDLPMLQKRNAEQQAIDNIRPAGNPARWSILNTWISLGIRLRTALGSEDQFKCVVDSYYRNAVLVLPDLILHPITTESVQALLLMSVFAENVEDQRSFVMLVTNSARQIELLARSCSGVVDRSEREIYERLLDFARVQDKKVAEKYGMLSMSNSLSI